MPIRPELRFHYPIDWPIISRSVRFERAGGRCESCRRPHGETVLQYLDGRWHDTAAGCWRNDHGRRVAAPHPDLCEFCVPKKVVTAACHRNHRPDDCRPRNLAAWCGRCHLRHDRPEHLRRRRLRYLAQRALGDLFLGPYPAV